MASTTNGLLVVGATLSGVAALMHLACLAVGAPLFRLLRAGEQMAQLHLAGHWYPTVVTWALPAFLLDGVLTLSPVPVQFANCRCGVPSSPQLRPSILFGESHSCRSWPTSPGTA